MSAARPDRVTIHGLAPIARADAVVLILGTMPGKESLRRGEYYAHPRNSFWPIVCATLGIEPGLAYAARVDQLARARVALWDVLQRCTRASSLDADIAAPVANDLRGFLRRHAQIERVYFNGAAAAELYRRHVIPTLAGERALTYARLPSTSPAHAAVSLAAKRAAWAAIAPVPRPRDAR